MINFKLVSPFELIQRRPFEVADPTILKPNGANPLLDGEFLSLNGYKMERGSSDVVPSFAVFAERGRYETQAIQKVPMLYMGMYEADTKIFDGTGITLGMKVIVGDVTIATLTKRGLLRWPAVPAALGATEFAVGYVTRLPANNNGFLRFIRNV